MTTVEIHLGGGSAFRNADGHHAYGDVIHGNRKRLAWRQRRVFQLNLKRAVGSRHFVFGFAATADGGLQRRVAFRTIVS